MKPNYRGGEGRRFILILALCGLIQGLSLSQLSGQDPPVQIAEDVFLLTGLGCNVLAISGEDAVLLIDNGREAGNRPVLPGGVVVDA